MVTILQTYWQRGLKCLSHLTYARSDSQKISGLASPTLSELDAAKVADRQALLAKPPEAAQWEASQVLHPELWRRTGGAIWTERLGRDDRHSQSEFQE